MGGRRGAGAEVCLSALLWTVAWSAPVRGADNNVLRTELKEGEREALGRAIEGAARRLERPRCQQIFRDFNDTSGRPLQESLEAAGRSGPGLLQDWIFFADGQQANRCADGRVLAFTQTGSRAVWICGRRFSQEWWRDRDWTEIVLIHEALHVLGLGEDPPSSEAISRRVLDRCGTAQGRAAAAPSSPAPILDSGLSDAVRIAVERSLPLAHQRIVRHRACGRLFARLGAEGTATMAATSYHPATPEKQRRYCRGTTHAFTRVRDTSVDLCPSFARLSRNEAALILIHEALHSAGQSEFPADPAAPDSVGITRMVMAGCGLF